MTPDTLLGLFITGFLFLLWPAYVLVQTSRPGPKQPRRKMWGPVEDGILHTTYGYYLKDESEE